MSIKALARLEIDRIFDRIVIRPRDPRESGRINPKLA